MLTFTCLCSENVSKVSRSATGSENSFLQIGRNIKKDSHKAEELERTKTWE